MASTTAGDDPGEAEACQWQVGFEFEQAVDPAGGDAKAADCGKAVDEADEEGTDERADVGIFVWNETVEAVADDEGHEHWINHVEEWHGEVDDGGNAEHGDQQRCDDGEGDDEFIGKLAPEVR